MWFSSNQSSIIHSNLLWSSTQLNLPLISPSLTSLAFSVRVWLPTKLKNAKLRKQNLSNVWHQSKVINKKLGNLISLKSSFIAQGNTILFSLEFYLLTCDTSKMFNILQNMQTNAKYRCKMTMADIVAANSIMEDRVLTKHLLAGYTQPRDV